MKRFLFLLALLAPLLAQFNPKAEEAKILALLNGTEAIPRAKDFVAWSGVSPMPNISGQPAPAPYPAAGVGQRKNQTQKEQIDWIEFSQSHDFAYAWSTGILEYDLGTPPVHHKTNRTRLIVFKNSPSGWQYVANFVRPIGDEYKPATVFVTKPPGWDQLKKPANLSPAAAELWAKVEQDPNQPHPAPPSTYLPTTISLSEPWKTPNFGQKRGERYSDAVYPIPQKRTNERFQNRIIRQELAESGEFAYQVLYAIRSYDYERNGVSTPTTRAACLLLVWKKVDGQWRTVAEFNRNLDGSTPPSTQ